MCTLVESMGRTPTKDVRTLALLLLLVTANQCQGSCPKGTYAAWGRDWCCNSLCGPGTAIAHSCSHDNPDDTVCEDCGPDYYNPFRDQLHCRRKDACDNPNEEMKVPGNSTANNECQCKIGFQRDGDMCLNGPSCPPGSGATRRGQCEMCPHGTFSNRTSRTQPCMPWQSCGMLGYLQLQPGTNTSDTVCISHPIELFLPTERCEIIPVTPIIPNHDSNTTDSTNVDRRSAVSNSTIICISAGISAGVAVTLLVVILVLRFCRKPRHKIVLENGEQSGSKTTFDPKSKEQEANGKNMELEQLIETEEVINDLSQEYDNTI
ncbi:TNFRSF6B [Branchiostoma lanceolatum]|uniref:TNFRSF6B protein n=1 Tax=Branchiostoma lanceolatum TaxID=7740 RepID=A0A8J9ZNW5_BRALA|nr:TNFRSF6B [Branchiostoma lanceolatum]